MRRAPVLDERGRGERERSSGSWAAVVAGAEAEGAKVGVVSAVAAFPMRERGVAPVILHMAVVLPDGRWADGTGTYTEAQVQTAHRPPGDRVQAVELMTPSEAWALVVAASGAAASGKRRRRRSAVRIGERGGVDGLRIGVGAA